MGCVEIPLWHQWCRSTSHCTVCEAACSAVAFGRSAFGLLCWWSDSGLCIHRNSSVIPWLIHLSTVRPWCRFIHSFQDAFCKIPVYSRFLFVPLGYQYPEYWCLDWGYCIVHLEVYMWTKGASSLKDMTIFTHDVCFPKLARFLVPGIWITLDGFGCGQQGFFIAESCPCFPIRFTMPKRGRHDSSSFASLACARCRQMILVSPSFFLIRSSGSTWSVNVSYRPCQSQRTSTMPIGHSGDVLVYGASR